MTRPGRFTVPLTLMAVVALAVGLVWALCAEWGSWSAGWAHDDAVDLWEAKEPTAYSFDYAYCSGMCAGTRLHVTVKNGKVVEAESRNEQCSTSCARRLASTIEEIFGKETWDRQSPVTDSYDIRYDPTWGFPATVDVRCSPGTADCGSLMEVTNFRVLSK